MLKVLFMVMKVKLLNGCGYHENKNQQSKHAGNVMIFGEFLRRMATCEKGGDSSPVARISLPYFQNLPIARVKDSVQEEKY